MAYFPMFVDLTNKPCLVFGGGNVAYRKILNLLDFEADVKVVSPEFIPEIRALEKNYGKKSFSKKGKITLVEKEADFSDCDDCMIVIAATDEELLNSQIAKHCKSRNIPVNAVDQKEDCSFIFPAYYKEKDVVAAFSSSGNGPVLAQYLKNREKEILTPAIGEINEVLGRWRSVVSGCIDDMDTKRKVYQDILDFGLCNGKAPTDEEVVALMESYGVKGR